MLNIVPTLSYGFNDLSEAANRIMKNRFLVKAMDYPVGSEEHDKLIDFSESIKMSVNSEGGTISLEESHNDALMNSDAYMTLNEGMTMLDTFFPEWVEDLITEDSPEIIGAVEEYAYNAISDAFGGDF